MKNIVLSLMCAVLLVMLPTQQTKAQAVSEGNVVVDVFYSFPNWMKTWFKTIEDANELAFSDYTSKASGFGPVGFAGEFLLSEKIGIGLEFTYTSAGYEETYDDGFGDPITSEYTRSKLRILPTFNFHLMSHDKLDFSLTAGVGYSNVNAEFTSTDGGTSYTFANLIPVSSRFGANLRYFFTDNIGGYVSIGSGGGLLRAGLSAKF